MNLLERSVIISEINQVEPAHFDALALKVFRYQATHNPLYQQYLDLLHIIPSKVQHLDQIPFLPISFFKTHDIKTGDWVAQTTFTSSSTTGQTPSKHPVQDIDYYKNNAWKGFKQFYGDPADWCVFALLPSYLERQGSSLVVMADDFISRSKYPESGFFLNEYEVLSKVLAHGMARRHQILLLGVSFALLDFAEQFPMDLSSIMVMETGGMKGRRRELTRPELHQILRETWNLKAVYSEYGMTELMSQAYTPQGGDRFSPMATMKVISTEITDPFCRVAWGRTGVLNIIDLANIDTCSFIATEDLGKTYENGSFEVLGRLDASEIRGCNLLTLTDG
jgi:hypothetical protein